MHAWRVRVFTRRGDKRRRYIRPFFFRASHIEAIRTHTHAGESEKDDPREGEREKDEPPHTRARLHDVWSSIPDTRRYINVERKSVGRRKKASEREKDDERKEKRDGM